MIIVFSNKKDYDSQSVIDWLHFFNEKLILVDTFSSQTDAKPEYSLNNDQPSLMLNNQNLLESEIKSIWFRRASKLQNETDILDEQPKEYLLQERQAYVDSFKLLLEENFKVLGSHKNGILNKISVLHTAKMFGLTVPNYLLSNNKKAIIEFIKNVKKEQLLNQSQIQ